MQTDYPMPTRRLEQVLINEKEQVIQWFFFFFFFFAQDDQRMKMKESEKVDKYLNITKDLKKLWNMWLPMKLTGVSEPGRIPKCKKKTDQMDQWNHHDHPDHNTVSISSKTQQSPDDLRRFVCVNSVKMLGILLLLLLMYQDSIEDSGDPSIQWLEDCIGKHEGGLITAIRNNTDNTMDNRMTITKKQKWE